MGKTDISRPDPIGFTDYFLIKRVQPDLRTIAKKGPIFKYD